MCIYIPSQLKGIPHTISIELPSPGSLTCFCCPRVRNVAHIARHKVNAMLLTKALAADKKQESTMLKSQHVRFPKIRGFACLNLHDNPLLAVGRGYIGLHVWLRASMVKMSPSQRSTSFVQNVPLNSVS